MRYLIVFLFFCLFSLSCYANSDHILTVDQCIVVSKDYKISLARANKQIEQFLNETDSQAEQNNLKQAVEKTVIKDFIDKCIMDNYAKKNNLKITTSDVHMKIAKLKKQYQNYSSFLTELAFIFEDIDFFVDVIRTEILKEKITAKIVENLSISDEELKKFVEDRKELKDDKVRLRRIALDDKKMLLEVVNKLKAGANFIALIEKYSVDEDYIVANKGDLGIISINDLPDKIYWEVYNLEIDQFSKPIEIDEKYYIYVLIEKIALDSKKLAAIKDYLYQEKKVNAFEKWLLRQKRTAKVKINPNFQYCYNSKEDLIFNCKD